MAENDKSPSQSVGDVFRLAKDYALQETVDPIKGLGKFIGIGVGAAAMGGIAIVLVLLGVLRLLQNETGQHLTGHLTWVPYLVTMVVAFILIAVAVKAIARKKGQQS